MSFTVLWQDKAEQALASIWLAAIDRESVVRAAAEIDSQLEHRPSDVGESRGSDERIIFCRPLGAAYSVSADDRTVRVLRVWQILDRGR